MEAAPRITTEVVRDFIAASPTSVCVLDLEARCVMVNPAFERLIGRPQAELTGLGIDELVHPDDRARLRALVPRVLAEAGEPVQVQYRLLRADGEVAHVVQSTTVARSSEGEPDYMVCQIVDLTDELQAKDDLARRLRQQSAVADFGRLAIAGDRELGRLMDCAVELALRTLKLDRAVVWELRPEGTSLTPRSAAPALDSSFRVAADAGAIAAIFERRDAIVVEDRDRAGELDCPLIPLAELGVRSAISVPVGRPDRPFGILGVYGDAPRRFEIDEQHFATSIANILSDAVERRDAEAEIRRRAMEDPVTGLPNRPLLEDRLRQALASGQRRGTHVAVLFIDLDDFKVVNDSLGHQAGDELLRAVAERLLGSVRASDTVARFGGDEFVIVSDAGMEADRATALAERILRVLSEPVRAGGVEHFVGASVGIRLAAPDESAEVETLLRDADTAMYRAKERGRSRYEVFDGEARRRAFARLQTEQELRRAVDERELRLLFQPFARLADGTWFGAESLLRWAHPRRGRLGPGAFLEVAEQSGLIVPIGEWTIREACRRGARWSTELGGDFLITVNVSPRQLRDRGLVEAVRAGLDESGMHAQQLGLEITEQALIDVSSEGERALAELHELGVRLLLDDFGTGYSSLSHLKQFPIHAIKIDRSFTGGLDSAHSDDTAIVRGILAMAWATGKFVITEGIETEAQLERLRRFGCRFGQGYLFARPLPASELERRIQRPLSPVPTDAGAEPLAFAETAAAVLGALEARLPPSAVWIGQLDYELHQLRIVATVGEASFGLYAGQETPIEGSLCHVMATGRGPQLCGDAEASAYGALAVQRALDVSSFAGHPVEVRGQTVGTLCAISRARDAFGRADLEAIASAAAAVGAELEDGSDEDVHEYLRRALHAWPPSRRRPAA